MRLSDLLREYRDGEEHGWQTEFDWIDAHHGDQQRDLEADIARNGIQKPVLLGTDGRVWDGHHRILAAHRLGLIDIPTEHP